MKYFPHFTPRYLTSIILLTLLLYAIKFLIDYLMTQEFPSGISVLRGLTGCFLLSLFFAPKQSKNP